MFTRHPWGRADATDDEAARRQTKSLASIVIILLLLVGGLFLIQRLKTAARIEDCLMSGRHNCDTMVTGQQ